MCNILIVEDEEIVSAGVRRTLQDAGYVHVEIRGNGIAALDYVASNPVDIVISDIRMPLMDGLTLIKQVSGKFSGTFSLLFSPATVNLNTRGRLCSTMCTIICSSLTTRKELTDIIDKMKAETSRHGRRQSQAADEKGSPIQSDNKWIVEMVDYVSKKYRQRRAQPEKACERGVVC